MQELNVPPSSPQTASAAKVTGTLYVATPKKIAKHAVHRNMVRRVLKEQWRRHALHEEASVLVRLMALPAQKAGQGEAVAALAETTKAKRTPVPKPALSNRLPDGALKRAVALEAVQLFDQLHQQLRAKQRSSQPGAQ